MIGGIHISPSDIILRKETAKNAVFSSLKTDQKVEATVLKSFSENKALVLIAGRKVLIKTPFLLTEGEKLQVNLLKEESRDSVKTLLPNENRIAGRLASLIRFVSKENPFAKLSKAGKEELLNLLKTISLKSGKTDENFLPRLLDKSGLLFEHKLSNLLKQGKTLQLKQEIVNLHKSDLKGYVLSQLNSPQGQSQGILKTFSEFTSSLENFQTFNVQSSDSGKYLIPFPIFSNDSFSFGQLMIDAGAEKEEQKGKTKERVVNISFLLNMSNLGALRADFSIYKKSVSGIFNLANREVRDFVQAMIPELKARLSKIEYLVHNVECKVASNEDLNPVSFVESFAEDDDRILNIII